MPGNCSVIDVPNWVNSHKARRHLGELASLEHETKALLGGKEVFHQKYTNGAVICLAKSSNDATETTLRLGHSGKGTRDARMPAAFNSKWPTRHLPEIDSIIVVIQV